LCITKKGQKSMVLNGQEGLAMRSSGQCLFSATRNVLKQRKVAICMAVFIFLAAIIGNNNGRISTYIIPLTKLLNEMYGRVVTFLVCYTEVWALRNMYFIER